MNSNSFAPGATKSRPQDWAGVPVPGSDADAAAIVSAPRLKDPVVSPHDSTNGIPPLPPGFTLDHPQPAIPPLPPGYTLDPHPTSDQPWLNDPVVAPSGSAQADQPWLNDPVVPQDTSYGSAFQEGLHDAAHGLGATGKVLANDLGMPTVAKGAEWLENAIPAPANYQSAGSDMLAKAKAGNLLAALKDLPRAAVEGAPAVAGGLGAAALGGAAGGPAGAAIGAGAYGAASAFGDDAEARAAANGDASPTAGDQLAAGATAAGQGALNAVGLARVPGVSAAIKALPALAKAPANAVLDAGSQAASNVVGQVGTTAGTKQGLTVDPDQVAEAAGTALAARGTGMAIGQLSGAVGSTAGSTVRSIGMDLAARPLLKDMSADQAASWTRINNAYAAQDPVRDGADPTTRMNALWKQVRMQVGQVVDAGRAVGQLSSDTTASLKTALQQAAVHKSALDRSLLDKLNSDSIDPSLSETLRNGLTDLDNLSQMVNYKQATGPFAALGAKLATPVAMLGGASMALHGMPLEGAAAMAAPWIGAAHGNLAGRYGSALGGMVDRAVGTNLPPALAVRLQAMQAAKDAGYDITGSTTGALDVAHGNLSALKDQQAVDAQAQAERVQAEAAKARAMDFQEKAANQVSGMAYKNSEEGIIAKANAAQRVKDVLSAAAADGRLRPPMSPDQQLRVSIGLPPSDPLPVNTPLDALGKPLNVSQSVAPQGQAASLPPAVASRLQATKALQAAQQPPIGPQLGQPPTPPQGAPQGIPPAGWLDHYKNSLVRAGVVPTPEVIGKALAHLVSNGQWSQDYANHMLSNPQQFLGDRSVPFQQAVAQAQTNAGMTPSPVVEEVKEPVKYAAAVQSRQVLGSALMHAADAEGDGDLKMALARILAAPQVSVQRGIEQRILAARQNDPAALARAKRLLPDELFRGKVASTSQD